MIEMILYVKDQQASADFYSRLLRQKAVLDVPGMTEFQLNPTTVLGLMPQSGIARLLGENIPEIREYTRVPRCELYLFEDDPAAALQHAIACGARELSPALPRDWGHEVAYCADPDQHIIAFAKKLKP
jgi:catechol 2,3-dioxygenase-like lactoylglutathione lyase family enzyme